MPKLDLDTIRQAMTGRGAELLTSLGGVSADVLDGKHHPCPKCGGTDRFRWDRSEEFAYCNQCFSTGNSDVIAAVQWITSKDFAAAAGSIGDYLGVKPLQDRKGDPEKDLEFLDWAPQLVPLFALKRPGITEEALLALGAKRAKYKRSQIVYALPVIGDGLNVEKPVGWVVMDAMGGTLPKYDRSGAVVDHVKTKLTYGSKPGFIGLHALQRLAVPGLVEVIWKVEGVTDALALWSLIPEQLRERHVVLTNANGASESPKWMSAAIAQAKPHVLHDADLPGDAGAKKWAKDVTRHGVEAIIVRLPYEIADTRGKDLRDWINEGHTYDELLELARSGDVCRPVGEGEEVDDADDLPMEELILKKLCLEVLYETESGHVRVFSTKLRKSSTFKEVDRLRRAKILQACGPVARSVISDDPDGTNTFSVKAISDAIATVASLRRGKSDDRGIGIWQGLKKDGSHDESLVIANNDEAARWNGERVLKRVFHPRVSGLVVDFGHEPENWFDYERLARYTAKAEESVEWREAAIGRSVSLFERWRWASPNTDPQLVTGLIMATWLQTIWSWRPHIAVIGESNSGKSTLFNALGGEGDGLGMFGHLALASSKSSEAGIRQGVRNTGRIILLDEFEKSSERQKILETFRASSRGDMVMKGTAGQHGLQFKLRHIAWVSAIESGLNQQPDRNRFVLLELLQANKREAGKLSLPSASELVDLGLQLLACSIVVGITAARLAAGLKSHKVEGASNRVIETYAVPASILGISLGMEEERIKELLEDLMVTVIAGRDEPDERDQDRLFGDILGSTIRCDHGVQYSVEQLLESYRGQETGQAPHTAYRENARHLERYGIGFRDRGICLHPATVTKELLRNTEWEGKQIKEVLGRYIDPDGGGKAEKSVLVKFSGRPKRCIVVPFPKMPESDPATVTLLPN